MLPKFIRADFYDEDYVLNEHEYKGSQFQSTNLF